MARRVLLKAGGRADVGERLLGSKLQMLSGSGNRRPGIALSILTGRIAEQLSSLDAFYAPDPVIIEEAPVVTFISELSEKPRRPHLLARTVYLTESHLRDIDAIIHAWQPDQSRRVTRSAVLRRAIEHLRDAVEADPGGLGVGDKDNHCWSANSHD
jgi:hypothetical protein